jgi:hypothetical protein
VKKGRHRRFEEARAMKRSHDVDFDALFDSLDTGSSSHEDDESPSSELDDEWDDEDDED